MNANELIELITFPFLPLRVTYLDDGETKNGDSRRGKLDMPRAPAKLALIHGRLGRGTRFLSRRHLFEGELQERDSPKDPCETK